MKIYLLVGYALGVIYNIPIVLNVIQLNVFNANGLIMLMKKLKIVWAMA